MNLIEYDHLCVHDIFSAQHMFFGKMIMLLSFDAFRAEIMSIIIDDFSKIIHFIYRGRTTELDFYIAT